MDIGNILFAVICWICALIFGGIALWAFKRRDPAHFWAGSIVKPEEISDIPAYNRANGLLWTFYAVSMVITGVISLFSISAGAIMLTVICVPGVAVLIIVYNKIYSKLKRSE